MTTCKRLVTNSRFKEERGIALVTALLLLAVLTGMSIAMYLSANSDMLTNKYYSNYRGSFYAADSGLTIVRQDMANKLLTKIDPGTNATTPPFTAATVSTILDSLKTAWASGGYKPLTTGAAAGSITEKFLLDPDALNLTLQGCAKISDTSQQCTLSYAIVSIGQSQGQQKNRIREEGALIVTVPFDSVPPPYFSGYGLYVEHQDVCDGSYFTPGTITGPVATEGCFTFGTSGSYIFTNDVACKGVAAGFQFSGKCIQSATKSYTYGTGKSKVTIAPTFQDDLNFNAPMPDLPASDYQQKRAVIDGIGLSTSVTAADMKKLRDYKGNAFTTQTSGVFLNYSDDKNSFNGGGFYVPGNADITLSTAMVPALLGSDPKTGAAFPACPSGNPNCYLQQIYNITSGGVTTTIKVTAVPNSNYDKNFPNDPATSYTMTGMGQTEVTVGTNTLLLHDVPTQRDNTGSYELNNAAMIYVDGEVKSLSGQVQDDAAITITAATNLTVNGNLTYKTPPVTKDTADALIPGNDRGQVIGLYTNNGNFQLNNPTKNGTIEVDASIATISNKNGATYGLTSIGQDISKLVIVGGRIHNQLHGANVSSRDVFFDKRFAQGLYPPFFPATQAGKTTENPNPATATFNRQKWVSLTSY